MVLLMGPVASLAEPAVEVQLKPHQRGRLVVEAYVNQRGPYDFLVDTGASTTLVDAALFQELGLRASGDVQLASVLGQKATALAVADAVSVGGLEISPITVLSVSKLEFGSLRVRGVLGENFLSRFDLLIDNQRGRLSLDPGRILADELEGERLPMTLTGAAGDDRSKARPLVWVKVAGFGARPMKLLLDSAADVLLLRPRSSLRRSTLPNGSEARLSVHSVYGAVECDSWEDGMQWGEYRASQMRMARCDAPAAAAAALDDEGSLPTRDFKRIFVSHSGAYAMVNPATRPKSAEPKAVSVQDVQAPGLCAESGTE